MRKFSEVHRERMGKALLAARRAGDRGEVPVGAALFRGGELLATAGNHMESHHNATVHAEMVLLRRLTKWQGIPPAELSLYVTLEPCPMCAGAIIMCRIGTVIWGARDPRYGATGSAFKVLGSGLPQPQPVLIGGVREKECELLLKDFFAKLR